MSTSRPFSRLKKPAITTEQTISDDEDVPSTPEEDDDYNGFDDDDVPRRKRRKKGSQNPSKKTIKGRRGKLAKLLDMPLDILFEIFGHLKPLDILHLSWTTRTLRSMLMSRCSRTIWKHSLSECDDLPECPPDLTEPQYTRLAFDHHCYFCQAPSVSTVLWSARVRSCKKCLNDHFIFLDGMDSHISDQLRNSLSNAGYHSISQLVNEIHARGLRRPDYFFPRFLTMEVQKFAAQASLLIGDEVEFKAFLEERRKQVLAITHHARKCHQWYEGKQSDRRDELSSARSNRRNMIHENLTKLGWETELNNIKKNEPYAFNNHPLIKQPKDLTDRIWANIEPQLVKWLKSKKQERLQRELIQRVVARSEILKDLYHEYRLQHLDEILPGVADIFILSEFQEVIDLGSDVTVTKEHFASVMSKLPEIVERWREENLGKLAQLVTPCVDVTQAIKGKGRITSPLSVLNLATSFFKCGFCGDSLSYQRLFHHNCLVSPQRQIGFENKTPETEIFFRLLDLPRHYVRPFGGAVYSGDLVRLAASFVKMNGLNPESALGDEMDKIDARFSCQACSTGTDRKVMSWRAAISHQSRIHKIERPRWSKLSEVDTATAKMLEEEHKCTAELLTLWKCVKCIPLSLQWGQQSSYSRLENKMDVIQHIRTVHLVKDPKEYRHYVRDLDSSHSYGGRLVVLKLEI